MEILVNVALLTVGVAGALTAFAGETIDNAADGDAKSPLRRVTGVGWTSIILLLVAFSLGVVKEIGAARTSAAKDRATDDAEKRRVRAEQELADANGRLKDVSTRLFETTDALVAARARMDALKPEVIKAVATLTQDIPRAVDDGWLNLRGVDEVRPRSNRTRSPLVLYGGDDFEYHSYCYGGTSFESPSPIPGVYLQAGTRRYILDQDHGAYRIVGPAGEPLTVKIVNPSRQNCNMKWEIKSTVQPRSRALLDSALAQ
jgi:hypothetical protein